MPIRATDAAVNMEIKERFFTAMRYIIAREEDFGIRTRTAFAEAIDWPQPNMFRAEKVPERSIPSRCLVSLVRQFDISADWLLTGRGDMWQTPHVLAPPVGKQKR